MYKIITYTIRSLKQTFRNWEMWIQIFVFPAFFLFAIAFLYGEETGFEVGVEHGEMFRVGVINNDDFESLKTTVQNYSSYIEKINLVGNPVSVGFGQNFIDNINNTNHLLPKTDTRFMVLYPLGSYEDAASMVQSRFVSLCFVIPEDFSKTLLTAINHKINITEGVSISSELIRSEAIVELIGDYSYARFSEASVLLEEQLQNYVKEFAYIEIPGNFNLKTINLTSVHFTEFHSFIPGFYIMTLLLSSVGISGILGREKESGTIDRLKLSDFSRIKLNLSLSLTQFITTGLQLITFFAAIYLLGFPGHGNPFIVSIVVCVSIIPLLGWGLLFAVILEGDAALYGPGLLSIPFSFLTGSFIPLPRISLFGDIQVWHLNPFYSTSEAIRKILFLNYDLNQVKFELSLLIIMGLFIYILGTAIFVKRVYK
ncbi:MAG: ABC transporter permease [Candidatus Thorarchaeota archaeon]